MEKKDKSAGAYTSGDRVYILLAGSEAAGVLEDWLSGRWECDLVVRRSRRERGKIVIETRDPMWARRIIDWHRHDGVAVRK